MKEKEASREESTPMFIEGVNVCPRPIRTEEDHTNALEKNDILLLCNLGDACNGSAYVGEDYPERDDSAMLLLLLCWMMV